jgi:hypothetical protein
MWAGRDIQWEKKGGGSVVGGAQREGRQHEPYS